MGLQRGPPAAARRRREARCRQAAPHRRALAWAPAQRRRPQAADHSCRARGLCRNARCGQQAAGTSQELGPSLPDMGAWLARHGVLACLIRDAATPALVVGIPPAGAVLLKPAMGGEQTKMFVDLFSSAPQSARETHGLGPRARCSGSGSAAPRVLRGVTTVTRLAAPCCALHPTATAHWAGPESALLPSTAHRRNTSASCSTSPTCRRSSPNHWPPLRQCTSCRLGDCAARQGLG